MALAVIVLDLAIMRQHDGGTELPFRDDRFLRLPSKATRRGVIVIVDECLSAAPTSLPCPYDIHIDLTSHKVKYVSIQVTLSEVVSNGSRVVGLSSGWMISYHAAAVLVFGLAE